MHPILTGFPSTAQFLRAVERELKIRYYQRTTIKSSLSALRRFLDWFGRLPHRVEREDVRNYLELLVDWL